jgi:hypothetical protein
VYTEKLKKLRETSKGGAASAPVSTPSTPGEAASAASGQAADLSVFRRESRPPKTEWVSSCYSRERPRLMLAAENAAPIIIISSSPTALISMYNVRRFLQDAAYAVFR